MEYIVELRNSGDLVSILDDAHEVCYTETVNEPATLSFAVPTDKASGLTRANEVWLRNYSTGVVVKKFRLNLRRDER